MSNGRMTAIAAKPIQFALLLLATVLVHSAHGQEKQGRWNEVDSQQNRATRGQDIGARGYYKERERGYYWYETDPAIDRAPEIKTPRVPGVPQPGTEPEPLSVKWLQQKLEETRVAAIDNPTRENVELYVYLQKISMDKAEKFALMSQQVATINPALDESYENPTTTMARTARLRAQEGEQSRVLKDVAKTVGIYYFFKSDCPYCAKQNVTLDAVSRNFGFRVMPISVDHRPMGDGVFPEWVPDRGQAEKLGISATPTLYLFHPPNEVVFLGAGLQTEGQLQKKILQVAEANKWLSKDELERAMRGLPRDFLVDAVEDLGEIDWSTPQSALEALRFASRRGLERAKMSDLMSNTTATTPEATPIK